MSVELGVIMEAGSCDTVECCQSCFQGVRDDRDSHGH